jgi:FMN phosphatase YigB (HAD superfamily)
MTPRFLYFDLGKVLVDFDAAQMYAQTARAAGIDPELARRVLFEGGLQRDYELGRLSSRQFHAAFRRRTGSCVADEPLALAFSDIFQPNGEVLALVAQFRAAGYRLGILSNTCEDHWRHCTGRFPVLAGLFEACALSYEIGACKPEPAIFLAAAGRAGIKPEEIFFTDDTAGHVAGARAVGFDAVQFTSAPDLVAALRQRGVQIDY